MGARGSMQELSLHTRILSIQEEIHLTLSTLHTGAPQLLGRGQLAHGDRDAIHDGSSPIQIPREEEVMTKLQDAHGKAKRNGERDTT